MSLLYRGFALVFIGFLLQGASGALDAKGLRDAHRPLIVFLGDSLTAGLGLAEGQAFPALVGQRLSASGRAVRIVNAGVSGDTTAGGLRRADWVLTQRPDILVVALGANDGLRGLPVGEMERNLEVIIGKARAAGARVLLCGMKVPPNYGRTYSEDFEAVFPRLAKRLKVPLLPFLLEGVAGQPALNQPDGIHPNAKGQERVADAVSRAVLELLR